MALSTFSHRDDLYFCVLCLYNSPNLFTLFARFANWHQNCLRMLRKLDCVLRAPPKTATAMNSGTREL